MPEPIDNQFGSQQVGSVRKAIFPIFIGAGGLFKMAYVGYALQAGRLTLLSISEFKMVNFTFTMQLYVLPLSFFGMLFLYFYDRTSFYAFLSLRLKKEKEHHSDWRTWGPIVLISFAIGTAFMMRTKVIANNGAINATFFKLFPLVVVFAATNAWTEEILGRFVIVGGLFGKLPQNAICWVSAVVFGIPHFLPGGIIGVISSGLLGWLLAKSVIKTKSLGWALLIHFLLDIIVFGAGAVVVAGTTT